MFFGCSAGTRRADREPVSVQEADFRVDWADVWAAASYLLGWRVAESLCSAWAKAETIRRALRQLRSSQSPHVTALTTLLAAHFTGLWSNEGPDRKINTTQNRFRFCFIFILFLFSPFPRSNSHPHPWWRKFWNAYQFANPCGLFHMSMLERAHRNSLESRGQY